MVSRNIIHKLVTWRQLRAALALLHPVAADAGLALIWKTTACRPLPNEALFQLRNDIIIVCACHAVHACAKPAKTQQPQRGGCQCGCPLQCIKSTMSCVRCTAAPHTVGMQVALNNIIGGVSCVCCSLEGRLKGAVTAVAANNNAPNVNQRHLWQQIHSSVCRQPGTSRCTCCHLQKRMSASDRPSLSQLCCLYTLTATSAAAVTADPTHAAQLP